MANIKIILTQLRDFLKDEIDYPAGSLARRRMIKENQTFHERLKAKLLPIEDENKIKELIEKIKGYPSESYPHIVVLIKNFKKESANNNHLYKTLLDPSKANLDKLMVNAIQSDEKRREITGSASNLVSETFETCVSAVGFLVKCILVPIVLPFSLLFGLALTCNSEKPFYGIAADYLSWINHSINEVPTHAKRVRMEFGFLTYDKTIQNASAFHGFFDKSNKNNDIASESEKTLSPKFKIIR